MRMKPSNMRKIREPLNVTKELSYVMLELYNVRIELSSVRKKKPPNVTKELALVILELHNVRTGAAQHNLEPKAKNLCGAFNM